MKLNNKHQQKPLLLVFAATALVTTPALNAQEGGGQQTFGASSERLMEEFVVVGRSRNAVEQLAMERIDDEVVSDILGAAAIGRLGDSTVAAALRRVPGLSLIDGKFVYIRGLGERYSASSLNSARIPSPDLTRNVIPLDFFPTSIVDSIQIKKSYSADQPANFGGGSVNIRTSGTPDEFVVELELSTGVNSAVDGDVYTYEGGDDDWLGTDDGSRALSAEILSSLQRFRGNVDVQGILTTLRNEEDPFTTLAEAQDVNRQLGLQLNRSIGLKKRDPGPDQGVRGSIGNNLQLGGEWEFGFLVGGSYDSSWRETTAISRNFVFPDTRTDTELESTRSTNISGNVNLGLRFSDDHEVSTTSLYLRSTDDETAIRDFFNENREIPDGIGFRNYRMQFEERDIFVHQIRGEHRLGAATRELLPTAFANLVGWVPEDLEFTWFYSDSDARTDIPNQVDVSSQTITDPVTGQTLSDSVTLDATAADYRFTDLDDEVINYGWEATLPLEFSNSFGEISVGYAHDRKSRTYRQYQFSIGALNVADPSVLSGPLDDVFSDANILDPANNFVFDTQGTNNQSYIAQTMTDALFGKFDLTLNETWRLSAGARWEDYRQVALDWNPLGFSIDDPQISTDPDVLANAVFEDDKVYPAASITYISDWMAETFQLRFGWSETTVRPDLREITDASYVDPITDDLVDGNPGVVPADVTNFDMRAEWFFENGNNATISFFYKDIDNPIEFFESAASDTTTAREIINADSAEVYGVEFEGLLGLGAVANALTPFFLQGNVTILDSELVAGPDADAPTNPVRQLSGASDYVVNLALGFDSPDARHSASLAYNVFGERLYVSGRNGAPDGFENPFHSLDLIYSWYPTDTLTFKLKWQNMLEESIEIEREGVVTFEEDPGSTVSLSAKWAI